jgi:hypothetical protein
MKQIYLAIFTSVLSFSAFAQAIVLDNTYNPTTQDKYTSHFLDKTALPGTAGASQVWDFSALSQDSAFSNVAVPVPASRMVAYPNANVAQITSYKDTTYYQVGANSELINWGYYSSFLGSTKYTDGQVILKYTLSFGDTFKDSVKGTSSIKYNGATLKTNRKGEAVVTYDGWGSILLPGQKSYPKVARIKSVLSGVDVVVGFTTTFLSTITSYSWYAEGVNYPVLNITAIDSPGLISDRVVIQSGPYDPAAVLDQNFSNSILVSPNPAQEIVNIQMNTSSNGAVSLTIKDPSGKTHLSSLVPAVSNGSIALNISSLQQGLYFLEIESNGLKAVKKIIRN